MGDQVQMVEIQTSNPDKVQQIIAPLQKVVQGRGQIVDWRQMNSALFQALEVERVAMFVVLSLIVLVAVFNILSSLIMLVRAKTRDIAILRTMGASRRGMMKVFMTVGVTIGSLGIVLGVILGAIFLYFRQDVVNAIQAVTGQNLWDPSVRFLTDLPAKPDPVEVVAIILTALILSFLSTLYPAYKAASTDPVQVLRYE
jgi:lipoprotein-releasing system permease protein